MAADSPLDPSTAAAAGGCRLIRHSDGWDHNHGNGVLCTLDCPAYEAKRMHAAAVTERAGYEHVNHPPHYNGHPAGVECIDIIEHAGHNVGAAIKYLWRAEWGTKPEAPKLQDLEKAAWYIQREIERLQGRRS